MSAMFVALTVVCVLGASAVMTTAGREGGVESAASAAANRLASLGQGAEVNSGAKAATVAPEREVGNSNVNVDLVAAVMRGATPSADQELTRVYQEITKLKSEVSALRRKSEPTLSSAELDDLRDKVGALRANMNLLQTSLDELSVGRDSETDMINKRLAKIEDAVSIGADITASIPRQTLPRKRVAPVGSWSAQESGTGTYLVKGPTGTFEVKIGSYVPGLGRIEAIRKESGRKYLVTSDYDGPVRTAP